MVTHKMPLVRVQSLSRTRVQALNF